MTAPRILIVGAGLMGRWHAYYAKRLGARLAGVVDPVRGLPGEVLYTDLGVCLDAVEADFAHICTPTETHVALAAECLSRGIHVICEKPPAMSVIETRRLLDLAADRGVTVSAVQQYPFQRGMRRLRERLSELGEVVEADFSAATGGADGRTNSERRRVLREILPHPLSVFADLFGADVLNADWTTPCDDGERLEMRATHGRLALRVSLSARARPIRNQCLVSGARASAYIDFYHGFSVIHSSADTRVQKAVRPLRMAAQLGGAAAANLVWRAAKRQPAYPGLEEFLRSRYDGAGTDGSTLLAIARLL